MLRTQARRRRPAATRIAALDPGRSFGIGALGFIAVMIAGLSALFVYNDYADSLVAPDELAINQPSYGAKIYDRNGKLLYEYVDDRSGLRRPVKLEDVAPAFLAATISTEDDSFFTNPGVNIKASAAPPGRTSARSSTDDERASKAPAAARSRSSWSRTSTSRRRTARSARPTASSRRSSSRWS